MPDLDRIEVRLTAQISDFQRAMQAAGKEVDSFASKGQQAAAATGNLSKSTDAGAKSTSTYAETIRQGYQLQEQLTKSQVGVIRGLENQIAAQRLSSRELAIYTALQRARTTADTEAGRVIAALAARHHDAANAAKVTSTVTQELNGRAAAAASSLGVMGSALVALGPAGIAAGAGLAVLTLGLNAAVKAANELADQAGKMVDFAETTGLTTTQLQALQKAGAFVGIEAEKIGQGFEKFTTSLEELRRGTGSLYEGLNRLDPQLTRQLALTRTSAEAWDVFSRAVANANREQANAIARAAFGRTGIPFTRLAGETVNAGGTAGLEKSLGEINTLSQEQLKRWDELKDRIDFTTKLAKQNIASIFTEDVLRSELQVAEGFLKISQAAKEFSLSGDWSRFIADLNSAGIGKLLDKAALLASVIPGMGALLSAARIANQAAGSGASGGLGWDTAGFEGLGGGGANVPLPSARPQELDPRFRVAELQKQIAAMGEAASSADRLRLAEMQLAIAAKEAGLSQEQQNRALAALRSADALSSMRDMVSALGSAATVTELQEYRLAQLSRQLQTGKIDWETYNRAVAASQRDFDMQRERDRLQVLGDAATETERYALKVADLQRMLEQGRISQETFNRAVLEAHPLLREARDIGVSFTKDLVQGLISGKSAMESLANAASNLSSKLADRAITQLFSGDFIGAAVSGVGALVTGVFARSQQKKQEQQQFMAEAARIRAQSQLIGLDTSTRSGALEALRINQQAELQQMGASGKINWFAVVAQQEAHRKQLAEFNKEWDKREIEQAEEKRKEELRIAEEAAKELANLQKSYADRRLAATTDASTVEGALALFDRQAQREREALLENATLRDRYVEASIDLEATLVAERLALQESFNKKALEETRRAAEQQIAAVSRAARQITDFLLGLDTSADTLLSPSARLAASRSAYQATLGLAQGGNIDALDRITKDAAAYIEAQRAFTGSGSATVEVVNAIKQQLTSLSAIQNSSDPVVRALNEIAVRQENFYLSDTAAAATSSASLEQSTVTVLNQILGVLTTGLSYDAQILGAINANVAASQAGALAATQAQQQAQAQAAAEAAAAADRAARQRQYENALAFWNFMVQSGEWSPNSIPPQPRDFGLRRGGLVPGYANGGMIGNGIYDRDSVFAQYAGRPGGVWLAGGEGVITAPIVAANGGRAWVDAVNRGGAANDNGWRNVVDQLRALRRENAMMQGQIAKLTAQLCGEVSGGFAEQNKVIKDTDRREKADTTARRRGRTAA